MTKLIICADFFGDAGGAEQTLRVLTDRLIEERGLKKEEVITILTTKLKGEHLDQFKDAIWIFGNYFHLIYSPLRQKLIDSDINYYVVEFDYKVCPTRNFELYAQKHGRPYAYDSHAERVDAFLAAARKVFFMSKRQMERHLLFCRLLNRENCVLSGSCFDEETLALLNKYKENAKEDICAVYGQPTWQKGSANAIFWCEQNNRRYKSLFGKNYTDFLEELSKCSTFVFLPNGADTSPRTAIEAQLMGVDLITSELAESYDEDWFMEEDLDKKRNYLRELPNKFAREIDL